MPLGRRASAFIKKTAREPEALVATVEPAGIATVRWRGGLLDYLALTKPEITFLVTISALAGFLLGSPGAIDGWRLFWTLVGIPLVSAGGAALNHYQERRPDALMRRTASRPLPAGRLSPESARALGYLLTGAGLALLCPLVNPLTGVLAAVAVALYVYVYTPLKRLTPFNTIVGTLPGALPALGGWTAATGKIGPAGLALFAVLVFWQLPHFMSLAWMYRKDYERAGFRMWTVDDESGRLTAWLTVGFTVLTVAASLAPRLLNVAGDLYLVGAALLGIWFFRPAVKFGKNRSAQHAKDVLRASIWYIPMLLLLIMVDRFF